ncbi:uncharacterized protein LOC101215856 [Cucumis sativus]|uniref:uncharacterized protein LOC101215856 n=1 Tax=Cucumis sativus TaxID=3659 RepID=UPI0002B4AE5D|nr:uncharacterized protein LOC101215856 [Cucumis sativus]KGN47988.2 hypothetical protein Csa_004242 [Cucumis sativus]
MIGSTRKLLSSPTESPDFRALNTTMEFSSPTRSSRPALNHDIFRSWNGKQIHLRDDHPFEYGFRLTSPQRSPQFYRSNYHTLSPPSKALAIATGQKELMEIVNNMPESCYELSLRDLVEQPMVLGQREDTGVDEKDSYLGGDREVFSRENRKSRKETRALVGRTSMENEGLYLKMGFPKSIGTTTRKKKKKNDSSLNMSAKVSPKPPQLVEKDWWKRRLSVSSESESLSYGSNVNNGSIKSSSSSSSDGSNKNRTKSTGRRANGGCWSWIYPKYHERDE